MSRPLNWPKCSQFFLEGTWMILEIKYYVKRCFMTPKLVNQTFLMLYSKYESLLANWGSNSPRIIARNGFTNDPKVTWIYEQRMGMCKVPFQSLICIMFKFIQAVMTLSKTTPKSQFRPLGKMHQIFSQCNKNEENGFQCLSTKHETWNTH